MLEMKEQDIVFLQMQVLVVRGAIVTSNGGIIDEEGETQAKRPRMANLTR